MAIYTVHIPPSGESESAWFIREGVNIFALIIPFFWLLWHRLWLELTVYIAFLFMLAVLMLLGGAKIVPFVSALPGLYLFVEGNQLVRARIERAGWMLDAVVDATTVAEAEIIYYEGGHLRPANTGNRTSRNHAGVLIDPSGNPKPASIGMFPE
ncbi:MAG: DUF2628 domain-containing protein [Rhizobiaceae bacterium]